MQELKTKIETMLGLMGLKSFSISFDETNKKFSVTIENEIWVKDNLAQLVSNFSSIIKLISKKFNYEAITFDINNYHREREVIIIDLAKAAARKALATKQPVTLPAMNSYERRLIHTEIGMRPDVKTESLGEGKDRYIVVKIVD